MPKDVTLSLIVDEDGALCMEWISSKFRVGLTIDTDPKESVWCAIGGQLGGPTDVAECGYVLDDIDIDDTLFDHCVRHLRELRTMIVEARADTDK